MKKQLLILVFRLVPISEPLHYSACCESLRSSQQFEDIFLFSPDLLIMTFFPQLPYTYTWQILSVLDSLSLLLASFGALPVLLCSSISSLLSWISELLWHPCGFHKPWPLLPTVPTHLKFELCCLGYLISELADIENNQATPGQVIMLLVWFLLLFLAHRMELGWGQGFCQTTMSQGVEGRKITSKNVIQCPTNFESSFFFSGY